MPVHVVSRGGLQVQQPVLLQQSSHHGPPYHIHIVHISIPCKRLEQYKTAHAYLLSMLPFDACRYISASEAAWRLFDLRMHGRKPPIQRLAVHLPNSQVIHYSDDADVAEVLQRNERTSLTAWFEFNGGSSAEAVEARQYLYHEFPEHDVWHDTPKASAHWTKRKPPKGKPRLCIGRMYMTSPGTSCLYIAASQAAANKRTDLHAPSVNLEPDAHPVLV